MQSLKQCLLPAFFVCFCVVTSCKKNDLKNLPATSNVTTNASDLLEDSALSYTRDIYLWYNQIPSNFNAHAFANPDSLMSGIRQFSIEPGFTQPVDRWSFGMKQQDWKNLSSGVSADFGLSVFFMQEGDLRVKYVEKASPAGMAGITRGWRILSINGNSNITTSNASFIIQNIYGSNTATFNFQKPDNSIVNLTLNASTYQEHPVILDTVYNSGSQKIGYFAFNSFLGDTTEIYKEFSRIFSKFASAQVSDVIIDLRYNGGGYVSVSEKLADYLIPSSGNGSVLMSQKYNDKYTRFNVSDPVIKAGSLNLSRVFFIVSKSTASASELVINNVKPFLNVQLIGPNKTYGKPVGFFPIAVGDWYIFPVSFRSTNKNGEGNYFNGIDLNHQVADGLDKNWGDLSESSLASAVSYITTGVFKPTNQAKSAVTETVSPEVQAGNNVLDQSSFKGAIGKTVRSR